MQKSLIARRTLDQLIALDQQTGFAMYKMGRLLSSISHGQLWEVLGYDSLAHLVEEELSFTMSTAGRYMNTFRHFQRLHYNKAEALDLITRFGWTHMAEYLPTAKQKVGTRAIKNRIEEIIANTKQVNLTLGARDHQEMLRVMRDHGLEISEAGRCANMSETFMKIIHTVKEAERRLPDLKSVA